LDVYINIQNHYWSQVRIYSLFDAYSISKFTIWETFGTIKNLIFKYNAGIILSFSGRKWVLTTSARNGWKQAKAVRQLGWVKGEFGNSSTLHWTRTTLNDTQPSIHFTYCSSGRYVRFKYIITYSSSRGWERR
jgi:hypothetical protein